MNEYLDMPIGKLYAKYLPSAITSLLLVAVASLIDTIVIAQFMGPVAMSAASICMPIFSSLVAISMMIVCGASTFYSYHIGKNDYEGANKYFTIATVIVLSIGIVYTIVGSIWTDEAIRFLGANDVLFDMSKEYGEIVFRFSLAYILFPLTQVFFRIDTDPTLPLIGVSVCGLLNAALDVLLVGPFIRPEGFGMAGAAYATCVSYAVGILIMSLHLLKKTNTLRLVRHAFSFNAVKKSFISGIPGSVMMLGNAVTVLVFNNFIIQGENGELYVAVYSVIVQVMTVAMGTYIGVAQCAQPIMAANYSAGLVDRLKKTLNIGLKLSILINGLLAAILCVTAAWIARVFSLDMGTTDMIDTSVIAIRVFAASLIFTSMNQMILYLFQSTNDVLRSSIISLMSSTILMIVGIYVLDGWLLASSESRVGIWLSYMFAQTLTLGLSLIFYARRKSYIFGGKENKLNLDNAKLS